jgi:hypothetical protein
VPRPPLAGRPLAASWHPADLDHFVSYFESWPQNGT